jgi:hypothetical protein
MNLDQVRAGYARLGLGRPSFYRLSHVISGLVRLLQVRTGYIRLGFDRSG